LEKKEKRPFKKSNLNEFYLLCWFEKKEKKKRRRKTMEYLAVILWKYPSIIQESLVSPKMLGKSAYFSWLNSLIIQIRP